ncbi:carboxypeptidase regulatory-like domain-containing protein [Actinoplanes sp. NPDC023714]|uniref:carboxypeptidase regulatory-like domain-containing protein n=1 Tax=Actinoplanes sp. NPDC023714 TaxID=3154322 RepID=UPI0033C0BF7F
MTFVRGRRVLTIAVAMVLAGFTLIAGAAPAQARPAVPAQPAITFPNGSQATAGGTITVTFDAGGDRRVTGFRYSLGTATLDAAVAAGVRGGTATVDLAVGDITGDRQLFAAAVDRFGRVGPLNLAAVSVTPAAGGQLTGTVLNGYTWQPIAGATVTLAPGGLQVTTGDNGAFTVGGVAAGTYAVTAAVGGDCPATSTQTLDIDGQGLYFEFYLFPECAPEQ